MILTVTFMGVLSYIVIALILVAIGAALIYFQEWLFLTYVILMFVAFGLLLSGMLGEALGLW